jgi:hypothetical protein
MRHEACEVTPSMKARIAIAVVFALFLALGRATADTCEAGTDETRAGLCDGFSGVTFGMCVALCEARECDRQPADDERCEVLRRGFDRVSGGVQPPC